MQILIGLIIGIIITGLLLSWYFVPKLTEKRQCDYEIEEQNRQAQKRQDELKHSIFDLETDREKKVKELQELVQKNNDLMVDAEIRAESYRRHYMEQAEKDIEHKRIELEEEYSKNKEDYQREYKIAMIEAAAELSARVGEYQLQIRDSEEDFNSINSLLDSKKAEYKAFVEILKKTQEEKEKQNFYQLQISPEDITEIEIIRSIIPKIRNADPINKIVYKTYYEKAYTDLVGRVIGSNKTCGIYKITNLIDGMAYIGQSVDIAERWRQHIKCGCGIDAPKNKLYQAMYNQGIENFSFEILEKCDKILLNDKEKLWIDNLGTNSYGYNMTAGGSKQ